MLNLILPWRQWASTGGCSQARTTCANARLWSSYLTLHQPTAQRKFVVEFTVYIRLFLISYWWNDFYVLFGSGMGLVNSFGSGECLFLMLSTLKSATGAQMSSSRTSSEHRGLLTPRACLFHRQGLPRGGLEPERSTYVRANSMANIDACQLCACAAVTGGVAQTQSDTITV